MFKNFVLNSLFNFFLNRVEDLLKDSDSEDENDKDNKSQKTNKSAKGKSGKAESRKEKNKGPLTWLQENENDDPLDLLDPMAIKRVLATKPLTKEELEKKKAVEAKSKAKNRGFKSKDGKLVINDDSDDDDDDSDDDMKSKKSKAGKKKQPDDLEEMMDTLSLSKKSVGASSFRKSKKRTIGEDSDDSDEEDAKSKFSYKSGGTGIHRKIDKNNKFKKVEYGSEYRAKVF